MTEPPKETLGQLRERFLKTSFCPARLIRGREETPICYTSLEVEYEGATHDSYLWAGMYRVLNYMDGERKKAERAFADWGSKDDAEFIRDVVEWFRRDAGDEQ